MQIACEIASSHNGDIELAKSMIDVIAENGCIPKFQSWQAKNVQDNDPDKKRYEKYQFPDEWYDELIPYCKEKGTEFMTSVFNAEMAEYLAGKGKKAKIASVSSTNYDLLAMCGANFDEVIVSVGMQDKETIEEISDILASNAKKYTLMVCTANYPTSPLKANLMRIKTLQEMLEGQEYASVGFSSHLMDVETVKMAMCMGIEYLEVHFTLSRYLPQVRHQMYMGGPMITTHEIALEPHELKELSTFRDKLGITQGSGEFKLNKVEEKIKERYLNRYGK